MAPAGHIRCNCAVKSSALLCVGDADNLQLLHSFLLLGGTQVCKDKGFTCQYITLAGQPNLPLCPPTPSFPIPLPLRQSLILSTPIPFQSPLLQTLPHPSIYPSIHLLSSTIYLSFIVSFWPTHLSLSLSPFVCLPFLLARAACV